MGRGIRNSEYFDDHGQISIFVPCRDGGSEILNPCGIKSRQLVLSRSCSLILGIRNSEHFYNYKQIIVFVPCHDGGSEILNPCGIKNRLPFCSVKLWARGSEILNLSKKESGMGARSLSHEIAQFDGVRKLDVLFLVDTTEHFFLLLISKSLSETPTFSPSNTNTLLNFPTLESHILVRKAFAN